jgi:hypothetical protein
MELSTIVVIFLAILAVSSVINEFVTEYRNLGYILTIWKRFRFLMLIEVIALMIFVVILIAILSVTIPFLQFGWMNLFVSGGGNLISAPVSAGSQSSITFVRFLPPLFFLTLIVVLPFFARYEEKLFRYGYEEWKGIIIQSIKFGLVHLVMGVSLATALAIIFAGLFFGYKYKKAFDKNVVTKDLDEAREEALLMSTTYHTLYNTVIAIILITIFITMI